MVYDKGWQYKTRQDKTLERKAIQYNIRHSKTGNARHYTTRQDESIQDNTTHAKKIQ